MVINSYKKYVLGLLLIAPVAISANVAQKLYNGVHDVVTGPIGWGTHAGLGYLGYEGYRAYTGLTEDSAAEILKVASFDIARSDLLATAGAALGTAALYHSALVYQYCTFGVQLRKLKSSNTSNNAVFRNRWAECDTAKELMDELKKNGGRQKDALKKQFLLNLGLKDNAAPLDGIKKIDAALAVLDKRLKTYSSYTNIVELTAQEMINEDSDAAALLDGDALIRDDLGLYSEDLLNRHASNSWISNSIFIGWYFKKDCYLKRPTIYTATYNMASRCAMKTLEQYGRLKAVRHILEQYVPGGQPRARGVVVRAV